MESEGLSMKPQPVNYQRGINNRTQYYRLNYQFIKISFYNPAVQQTNNSQLIILPNKQF